MRITNKIVVLAVKGCKPPVQSLPLLLIIMSSKSLSFRVSAGEAVAAEPAGPAGRSRLSSLDWALLGALDALDARAHTGRFLTMHKRRRRRPTTRSLQHHPALLDDIHHGLVQCVLDRVSLWPFNAFALDTVTGGECNLLFMLLLCLIFTVNTFNTNFEVEYVF